MKKILVAALVLFTILVIPKIYGGPPAYIHGDPGLFYTGPSGEPVPVTATSPLPTSAQFSASGTLPVLPNPISTGAAGLVTVTAVSQVITPLASRTAIIFSHLGTETVWIKTHGGPAVVGQCKPLYQGGFMYIALTDAVQVAVICSTTAKIEVDQGVAR